MKHKVLKSQITKMSVTYDDKIYIHINKESMQGEKINISV